MLSKIVQKYYLDINNEKHHRYRSWEHCYKYFRGHKEISTYDKKDLAALHLAFYLASWGMYRGSSFLLQKDYQVHQYAIDVLLNSKYKVLWNIDIGDKEFKNNINLIIDLKNELFRSYADNINFVNGEERDINVTDTLSSKIVLGTVGVVPAYDRYFIEGLKFHGFGYKNFNEKSLLELVDFYNLFSNEFDNLKEITRNNGFEYPLIKLIDMYFWQVGYLLDKSNEITNEETEIIEYYSLVFKKFSSKSNNNKTKITKESYSKSIVDMVIEAVEEMIGDFTSRQIKDYIHNKYGEVNDGTINCHIIMGIVNRDSRTNWYVNKKERISDSKHDFIYDKGNGKLEKYDINKHGLWEIKFHDGKYIVQKKEEIMVEE